MLQEENEIPASVYVKDSPPFPRDEILTECVELVPGTDGCQAQEGELQTIQLSSDEDVGLDAEMEKEDVLLQDLENTEKSRAEKLKFSSLKKVSRSVRKTRSLFRSLFFLRIGHLSPGGQSEEGLLQAEHREEDDQDWDKDCLPGTA